MKHVDLYSDSTPIICAATYGCLLGLAFDEGIGCVCICGLSFAVAGAICVHIYHAMDPVKEHRINMYN